MVAALAAPAAAQQRADCSDAELTRAAARVETDRQALHALPIGDGRPTPVSPESQRVIAVFKDRLAAFVTQHMACAEAAATPAAVQDRLSQDTPDIPSIDSRYGDVVRFEARRPATPGGLMAIVARFDVECGKDALLLVFEQGTGGWKPVLRWQAPPYPEISGAFWSFDYLISSDGAGGWYVLTKSIRPWCSSTWSSIRYSVLRPIRGRTEPDVSFERSDPIWWGGDDFGTLAAQPGSFEVRFHAQSVDPGVHSRVFVRRFALNGASVRRVSPLALSPQDFVDEWIASPWSEAAAWSAPEVRRQQALHDRLNAQDGRGLLEFAAVRTCERADLVQVELERELDDTLYFQVEGRDGAFHMAAIAPDPEPACEGR